MRTSRIQCKMRGKKSMMLPCRCCDAINLKDEIREKEAGDEIKRFVKDDKDGYSENR